MWNKLHAGLQGPYDESINIMMYGYWLPRVKTVVFAQNTDILPYKQDELRTSTRCNPRFMIFVRLNLFRNKIKNFFEKFYLTFYIIYSYIIYCKHIDVIS